MDHNMQFAPWAAPFFYPAPYKSAMGGRGSGKSHTIARIALLRMMLAFSDPNRIGTNLPYYPALPVKILSGRQFNASLEDSVKAVMRDLIYEFRLMDQFFIGQLQIVHKPTESQCLFHGIDRNISSIRSKEGYHIWWFEEAQFLTQEQMNVVLPTIRTYMVCPITKRRYPPELWCVWNPIDRNGWTWQRFVEYPMAKDVHAHVNYYDNPWLPENLLELADYDKINHPSMYDHVWLGKPNDGDASEQILPYPMVKACVDAWNKRPSEDRLSAYNARTDMGVDVAVGGADKCAAVLRTGPVVRDIKLWNGSLDTDLTARTAVKFMEEQCEMNRVQPWTIYYDASTPMDSAFFNASSPVPFNAINFGSSPGGKDVIWESDVTNDAYFARRNIQMATAVRQRAHRTMKFANGDKGIDPMDCLFINPKIEGLDRTISLLSQPMRFQANTGKWDIDKRGGLKSAKSPDEFDALCLAFADDSDYGLESERTF
ncbi:MAG: hypothetical protein ISN29_02110 [Gammaproteobacteria bacterium AqS3]|nr:hypothetical protein [Gammaproteobacteria bacterium AqS3]